MARKILLLEIVGPNVTTLTGSPFDGSFLGANCALSNGNTTLTATAGGAYSSSRSVMFKALGQFYIEWVINSISSSNSGIFAGFMNNAAVATNFVGFSTGGYGATSTPTSGVYNNNVGGVAFPSGYAVGDVIGCAADFTNGKIYFHKNGVWINGSNPVTATNPAYTGLSGAYFTAATVRGFVSAGNCDSITMLSDPSQQQYQAPAGFGTWTSSATVAGSNYYFASEGFTTAPTDSPANQYYDARIAADGDPIYDRSVTCAIWTNTNTTSIGGQYSDAPSGIASAATIALGDISLNNTDGGIDSFVTTTMRGGTVTLKLGYFGQAFTAYNVVATGVIDNVGSTDEHTVKVYLRGKMARLDLAIQTTLYDATTPNLALEGTPLPFALGDCQWVPLITVDPANLEYQLADSPFGVVTELRDQGVKITQGVGWSSGAEDVKTGAHDYGVRRLTNPAGRQCAKVTGNLSLGASAITASNPFGTWTAGVPAGWSKTIGANTTFVQGTGTLAVFGCTVATAGAYISTVDSTSNASAIGNLYYAEVVCTAVTSGSIDVLCSGHSSTVVIGTITKPGTYRFAFVATTTTSVISFAWGKVVCSGVTLSGVTCVLATKIERLPAWLSYLCVTRGGLSAGDIDSAGTIAALDTLAPYKMNFYCQDQTRYPDLIKDTMDTFCGWIWESRLGVLSVGRLALPAATSVLTLTDQEIVGDIIYTTDTATGLSPACAGTENYSVHGESDIAASLFVPGTGDPTTAAQLQQAYLSIKKGNGTLSPLYSTQANNAPMATLLTDPLQVAIEANRRAGMFTAQRAFYSFSAFVDDTTSYTLNPGDTITVQTGTQVNTHQRYDLTPTPGKNLVLVGLKSRFLSNKIDLVAWG